MECNFPPDDAKRNGLSLYSWRGNLALLFVCFVDSLACIISKLYVAENMVGAARHVPWLLVSCRRASIGQASGFSCSSL